MKASRLIPLLLLAGAALPACSGPSRKDLQAVSAAKSDTLAAIRNELLDQVMEGTRFVNEINKELAKARSLSTPAARQLQPTAEIADANEERKQVVARIAQLVTRLEQVQSRLTATRAQLQNTDSALAQKVAEYEQMVAEVNQSAEKQRAEFQVLIDSQQATIASLTQQVDTLGGALGKLTTEHNAVYYIVGTRKELLDKGVLIPEGRKRFLIAGPRRIAPARELDSSLFTRIDQRTDTSIVLPDGVYKMVSRQNGALVFPDTVIDGGMTGTLRIEQPERFWSSSRFLILVRS